MYNFKKRRFDHEKDQEFPALCKNVVHVMPTVDYTAIKQNADADVIKEEIQAIEVAPLPLPPKRIMFPLMETYDWSKVPKHFINDTF
jgi:hypothetical protein